MKRNNILLANKKAWIRIAESAIAVMILASVMLVLIARQGEKKGISEEMYKLQHLILEEAAKNESVRNAVLNSVNLNLIDDFIGVRMPIGIDFNITICNPTGVCDVETPTVNKELYADDILISSTLQQYQLKRLKIVSWVSGGETVRKRYAATNAVIIYYFDEGSGSIVRDSSGNSFNGEIVGTQDWVDGKYGKALNFDGTNYVNITSLPEIRDAITIEAWIKPESLGNRDTIVMKPYTSDVNPRRMYALMISNNDNLRLTITINNNPYFIDSPTNSLKTGEWQHVAGTYDGSKIRVYINGAEAAATSISGQIDTNLMPVWIAKGRVSGSQNSFEGSIDNVRIYSKALTATEILEHYQG
jgi:hypothetical protein